MNFKEFLKEKAEKNYKYYAGTSGTSSDNFIAKSKKEGMKIYSHKNSDPSRII